MGSIFILSKNLFLLDSGTPNVQFSTAKLILELSGYSKQNISINVNTKSDRENKQDEELMEEFLTLVKDLPEDRAKRVENMIDNFSKQETKKH